MSDPHLGPVTRFLLVGVVGHSPFFEVEVKLRLMVSLLGARLSSDAHYQIFVFCLTVAGFLYGAPSVMRGWVSNLLIQLLLGLSRATAIRSKSRRTHDHILHSRLRLPQPGEPGPYILILQEQSGIVIPPATGFPFCCLLRFPGLWWRYSNQPWFKFKLFCYWLSISQFVLVSGTHLETMTRFLLLSHIFRFHVVGHPLWQEDESVVNSVTLESKSHRTHDHILLSRLRLLQPGDPGPSIYIAYEHGGPVMPPGTGFPLHCILQVVELQWRYSALKLKPKPCYNWRLVSQYVEVSSPL
jgi:hypothetical protein